jgi:hypothetical protein
MFKVFTIIAFLSAQLSLPSFAYANDPILSEFQQGAKETEEQVAKEQAAKEEKERVQDLKNSIRDNTLMLAARVEQLETLSEKVPNVSEDTIEDSLRNLRAAEREDDKEDLFGISAVIAVGSAVVYALTKYDFPRAVVVAKSGPNAKVKTTAVNKSLRSVYGNKTVAKAAGVTGILAALLAAYTFADSKTLSPAEVAAIETMENNYLSRLVSAGQYEHLTGSEIDAAFDNYKDNPEFRQAVINEVQVIVSEVSRLDNEIRTARQEIANLK